MEFVARSVNTVTVIGVNNKYESLRVGVIVAPEGADLVLAADVPHGERDVLVLDGLDVEADGRDGGHDLAQLELVQDGGLAGRVEADHEDAHVLLAEELAEDLGEGETHGGARGWVCLHARFRAGRGQGAGAGGEAPRRRAWLTKSDVRWRGKVDALIYK